MPNIVGRIFHHAAEDWRALMYAKTTFGLISLFLVGATAIATWIAAGSYYSEEFATIETSTRNLLVQVGQLNKGAGPQTPSVYGASRLQLMDVHVTFDPPHKPNIFGNVINKGALPARDPASGASYVIAPKELTTEELDGLAVQAVNARTGNRGFEFKPDEVHGFSLDFNMTPEQFEDVKAGKQKLYFMYVVSNLDETVPSGKMRLTEACYVYEGGLNRGQLCPEHNRAFTPEFVPSRQ